MKQKSHGDGLVFALALIATALAGWFGLGEIVVNQSPAVPPTMSSSDGGGQ